MRASRTGRHFRRYGLSNSTRCEIDVAIAAAMRRIAEIKLERQEFRELKSVNIAHKVCHKARMMVEARGIKMKVGKCYYTVPDALRLFIQAQRLVLEKGRDDEKHFMIKTSARFAHGEGSDYAPVVTPSSWAIIRGYVNKYGD